MIFFWFFYFFPRTLCLQVTVSVELMLTCMLSLRNNTMYNCIHVYSILLPYYFCKINRSYGNFASLMFGDYKILFYELQHAYTQFAFSLEISAGFVCVRGFDRTLRAPRPLYARLHFPASKVARGKRPGAARVEEQYIEEIEELTRRWIARNEVLTPK